MLTSGICLLVVLYMLGTADRYDPASLALQQRRQHISHAMTLYNYSVEQYISYINTLLFGQLTSYVMKLYHYVTGQRVSHAMTIYNYSVGLVWPRNDIDDHDDRIMSQIDVMNVYARQTRNRNLKIILRVGNFNFENWFAGQEQFVREGCPIVDCWLTNDQSHAHDADALLISEFDESSRKLYLPKPHRQIWIAQHWESPLHNRINPKSVRGLINWTASYRHDSTVAFRYGKVVPSVQATTAVTSGEGSTNYAAGKTRLVAWFVSNCHAMNERMRYARELSQSIQV